MGKKLVSISLRFGFKEALLFFIGIFLICYSYDVFINNSTENKYPAASNPVLDLSEGEIKDFLIVSQRFADNHNYLREEYNCINYTRDLKQIADQLGFDVEQVIGCNSSSLPKECHAWLTLKVDFEPQSAKFVDYSKKYPYQSKRK